MQKFIADRIKEKIKLNERDLADSHITALVYAKPEYYEGNPDAVPNPDAQKDSAKRSIEKIEKRIKVLKAILKEGTRNER